MRIKLSLARSCQSSVSNETEEQTPALVSRYRYLSLCPAFGKWFQKLALIRGPSYPFETGLRPPGRRCDATWARTRSTLPCSAADWTSPPRKTPATPTPTTWMIPAGLDDLDGRKSCAGTCTSGRGCRCLFSTRSMEQNLSALRQLGLSSATKSGRKPCQRARIDEGAPGGEGFPVTTESWYFAFFPLIAQLPLPLHFVPVRRMSQPKVE